MYISKFISRICYCISVFSFPYWLFKYGMAEYHNPEYFFHTILIIFISALIGIVFDNIYINIKNQKIKNRNKIASIKNAERIKEIIFQNRMNMNIDV